LWHALCRAVNVKGAVGTHPLVPFGNLGCTVELFVESISRGCLGLMRRPCPRWARCIVCKCHSIHDAYTMYVRLLCCVVQGGPRLGLQERGGKRGLPYYTVRSCRRVTRGGGERLYPGSC
jgi:hypothetical protein